MNYLIANLWGWMLAALIFGLIVGWLTCSRERGSWFSGWVPWALVIFALALVAALFAWLPGRSGLWLETALLLFASYVAGCCIGCWLKQLFGGAASVETAALPAAAAVAAAAAPAALQRAPAPVAAKPVAPTVAAAPVPLAARPASANLGGPITPLPEPVFSALKLRPQSAPVARAPIAPAPVPPVRANPAPIATAPPRPPIPAAAPAMGGPLTPLPDPVASALRQRLQASIVPVTPHPMSGLPRPGQAQAAAPAATVRPATSSPVSAGLPEPVASALRQTIPHTDGASAQLTGAGVRVTHAAATAPAKPAAVTLAHAAQGDSVRLEAHVGAVTATGADTHPGVRPRGITTARGSAADDLILIKGVGPKNEQILHSLGIYHFDQIAHWTPQEAEWVGSYMKFPGRIEREHWIEQCKLLAAGGDTAHSLAVKSGKLRRDDSADAAVSAADAAALRAGLEELAPRLPDEDKHEGKRPFGLLKPRGGKADDLKRIRGIGPQNEGRLHALGIWHFDQIARWTKENVLWVGSFLAFPGRIDREEWLAQAKVLASGQETEFSKRADAGLVATSKDDGSKGQGNVAPIDRKK